MERKSNTAFDRLMSMNVNRTFILSSAYFHRVLAVNFDVNHGHLRRRIRRAFVQLKHACVEDHYVYNERKDEDGPLSSRRPCSEKLCTGVLVRNKMTGDAVQSFANDVSD